jgi:hypothetical protein
LGHFYNFKRSHQADSNILLPVITYKTLLKFANREGKWWGIGLVIPGSRPQEHVTHARAFRSKVRKQINFGHQ